MGLADRRYDIGSVYIDPQTGEVNFFPGLSELRPPLSEEEEKRCYAIAEQVYNNFLREVRTYAATLALPSGRLEYTPPEPPKTAEEQQAMMMRSEISTRQGRAD